MSITKVITVPEQGPPGVPGSTGPAGEDGNTVIYGSLPPTAAIGKDGDFYIDTVTHFLYGPKAFGAWPTGTSLIGPAGPTGPLVLRCGWFDGCYGGAGQSGWHSLRLV
jgi:hypothetical protein